MAATTKPEFNIYDPAQVARAYRDWEARENERDARLDAVEELTAFAKAGLPIPAQYRDHPSVVVRGADSEQMGGALLNQQRQRHNPRGDMQRAWLGGNQQTREALAKGGWSPPTLGETIGTLALSYLEGHGQIPEYDLHMLRGMSGSITRSGTESQSGGATYGFAVKPEWSPSIYDRDRGFGNPYAPLNMVGRAGRIYRTNALEYKVLGFNETNQGNGLVYGGVNAGFLTESQAASTATDAYTGKAIKSDASLLEITFKLGHLVAYMELSRDLINDSFRTGKLAGMPDRSLVFDGSFGRGGADAAGSIAQDAITTAITGALRQRIEQYMISGGAPGPLGITRAPGTIGVSRAGSGAITEADVNNVFTRFNPPSIESGFATWCCSSDARLQLDAMATDTQASGMWNKTTYLRGDMNMPITLLKGLPVVTPTQGMPTNSLFLADWSAYGLCLRNANAIGDPGMRIDIGPPGLNWLPNGTIEARYSDHLRFDTNIVGVYVKVRLDGKPMWHLPVTPFNASSTVSCCVTLLGS